MSQDPMETIIADALTKAGIRFLLEHERPAEANVLDFYLPESGVYIEVKQFYTPRIAAQMASQKNVICIQGRAAAEWFASRLAPGAPATETPAAYERLKQ